MGDPWDEQLPTWLLVVVLGVVILAGLLLVLYLVGVVRGAQG